MFKEATNIGIKGKLDTVMDLTLNIEKTASEVKLRKFLIKLGAGIIVVGQAR